MPPDRRGPHSKETGVGSVVGGEGDSAGGRRLPSGKGRTSTGIAVAPLAAAQRLLVLLLTVVLAVQEGEGLITTSSVSGGGLSMKLIGRRSGAAAAALRWRANASCGLLARTARHTPSAFFPAAAGCVSNPFNSIRRRDNVSIGGARAASPLKVAATASAASSAPTMPPSIAKAAAPAKTKNVATAATAATTAATTKKTNKIPSTTKKAAAAPYAKKKGTKPRAGTGEGSKKVLVIVESPAKARTISALLERAGGGGGAGALGKGYTVDACNGHVTDLVSKRKDVPLELKEKTKGWDVVGVDVENDFEPLYIHNAKKKAIINRLKKVSAKCDEIILATDQDREGEAISWHLLQVLEPTVPVKRAVFHEITQDALVKAFQEPGEININLVQAQEARRILDRLAGFTLTPVIWNFVAPGLSAGRVQSVALAMVVERERARLKFRSAEYWDVVANVTAKGEPDRPFEARLVQVGSKTVVSGKDFDPDTGEIKEKLDASKLELLGSEKAEAVAASLSSLEVLKVEKRRVRRQPPAPFITSTLQQEASRKLGLGADQTMRAAQALYEAGHITYMRTDRPSLSKEAAGVAERAVRESFGDEYVKKGGAKKAAKVKGSQEAHEAIRPALVGAVAAANTGPASDAASAVTAGPEVEPAAAAAGRFRHPSELAVEAEGLEDQQRALYDLVYRRTLASAMAESEADFTAVSLGAGGVSLGGGEVGNVVFKATGKTTIFEGFLKAYREGLDEGHPADDAEGGDQETELPEMVEGGGVVCEAARPASHRTSPPRRYTEASFIKELEVQGVGRPSTYASIIGTLKTRTYVNMQGRSLIPSLTGFVVADLLSEHFPDLTDTAFTAKMEDKLDAIARGEKGRVEYLSEYYLGEEGLKARVARKRGTIDPVEAKRARLPGLESLDNRCSILVGPYGGYLIPEAGGGGGHGAGGSVVGKQDAGVGKSGGREEEGSAEGADGKGGVEEKKESAAVALPYVAQENLELLTVDLVERCLDSTYRGGDLLGQHPDTGEDIRIRMGRYGPFLECGDKKVSASAHISNANKKDPTDLSMPSPLTPTELPQQRQQQQARQEAAVSAVGIGNGDDTATAAGVLSAEDVIAFGLGASNTGDAGGTGGGGGGTWYSAISLERAVGLLSLPRVVCESHPTEGGPIEVGVGRFGVWVKHGDSYKNVPGGVDVLDVDEPLAVRLVDEMIQRNKDRPTVEIGMLGGDKVLVKYSKYGRCISCGGTVAMLPPQYRKTKSNPTPPEIPLDEAIEAILEKRAKDGPAARGRKKGSGGSNSPTATAGATSGGGGAVAKRRGRPAGGRNAGTGGSGALGGQKRPLSGFLRFCRDSREVHTAAAEEDGGAAGAEGASLSPEVLSARWKALDEGERRKFNDAASAALDQWKADNMKAKSCDGGGGHGGSGVSRSPSPPKNAYILFSSERRPRLKEEVGGVLNAVEMTKKLAQEWRDLEGSSVREEYVRRAGLLREAWLKEKEEVAGAAPSSQTNAPAWVGGGVGDGRAKKPAATGAVATRP